MRLILILLACLLPAPPAPAALPDATADPELSKRVSVLIGQLDSDDYQVRDAATTALEDLPREALPLIEDALSAGTVSPEVALRLEKKVALLRRKAAATAYDRRLRQELDWSRAHVLACYDHGGHTNPKWDRAAREALLMCVRPSFDPNRTPRDDQRIAAAFRRAIDLGCDDPFLVNIYATSFRQAAGLDPKRAREMAYAGAKGVLEGNYPAFRKLAVAARRAEADLLTDGDRPTAGAREKATRDLDAALKLFPEAARDRTPRFVLLEAAVLFRQCYTRVLADPTAAFDKVQAVFRLATAAAETGAGNIAALFEAEFHLERAEAIRYRRDEYVNESDRQKRGDEHRVRARAALDRALAEDPDDPVALNDMLRLLDLTAADRAEFDRWFAKAMAADPSNRRACSIKLAYLRRQNAQDEALAFARECLAGGDWWNRIPLLVVDQHAEMASFNHPDTHFTREDVWADVETAYENYLKRYPNAVVDRSYYAKFACYAQRWDVAKAQFDLLGDNAVYSVFRGKQTYDYLRRKAERLAKQG